MGETFSLLLKEKFSSYLDIYNFSVTSLNEIKVKAIISITLYQFAYTHLVAILLFY